MPRDDEEQVGRTGRTGRAEQGRTTALGPDAEMAAVISASQLGNERPWWELTMKRGRSPTTIPVRFGGTETKEAEKMRLEKERAAKLTPFTRAVADAVRRIEEEKAAKEATRVRP